MSRYWENVTWQNEAGRWGIGFFKRVSGFGSANSDYDSEWEDQFDTTEFHFASTGHASEASATRSWRGANPGTSDVYEWNEENAAAILEFEDMAKACNNPAYAAERRMKIENAKATKFFNELRTRLREKTITAGRYRVRISASRIVDGFGLSTTITGTLYQEGDWLLLKYIDNKNKEVVAQVWNIKTRSQGQKILDIDSDSRVSYRW